MFKNVVVLCCILFVKSSANRNTATYRSDYEYNEKTKAFYKFHIEALTELRASETCHVEGAQLMQVKTDDDLEQAHGMFKKYTGIGNLAWIGNDSRNYHAENDHNEKGMEIEMHKSVSDEIVNIGWTLDCTLLNRDGSVKPFQCTYYIHPFICKVEAKDAFYDEHCKVFGRDYAFVPNVGSCYKVPRIAYNWNQAYAYCAAEGAHLAVINSEAEKLAVRHILNTEPPVRHAAITYFFFAGFRANRPADQSERVFKTVSNQTLEEIGFSNWAEQEPNNARNSEYCGCIFKNEGTYNDFDCDISIAFICEKEIGVDVNS